LSTHCTSRSHGKDEQTIERMAKMNPLERLGTPTDISEVVSVLAGPWTLDHRPDHLRERGVA